MKTNKTQIVGFREVRPHGIHLVFNKGIALRGEAEEKEWMIDWVNFEMLLVQGDIQCKDKLLAEIKKARESIKYENT